MHIAIDRNSAAPLYSQLRDELKRQIQSGVLPAGGRLPPVRRISRDCDLSFLTVMRAMTELTREGWIDSRRGVGTFVLPRQMEVGIEVLMAGHPPRTSHMISFHEQILTGLRKGAEPLPCRLWVSYLDGRWPTARELLDVARSRQLTGLVVYNPPEDLYPALREAAEQTPIASIRAPVPESRVDCIQPDPGEGIRAMLVRRLESGARHFAYVGFGRLDAAPYGIMYRTLLDTLREAGIDPFVQIAPADLVGPHGRMERVDAYLAQTSAALPENCVVLCQTAHVAEKLLLAGRRFDAVSYTETPSTLETFRGQVSFACVTMESMAREAVRLLTDRRAGAGGEGRMVGVAAEVHDVLAAGT